ncbi:hypothetical protein BGX26_009810 [Mortierella sp. AD094]|nr:hypothetical protein BGX26_009810 [Mortierella sp. AD094]
MPRSKATIIVESSSDESAPGIERKRVTRASTSSNTRSTRQSTHNEPSISGKSVASKAAVAVRSSKRKAVEEPKASVLSVEISPKANKDTPKRATKAAPASTTAKKEVIKASPKKDLGKENNINDSGIKSTGNKTRKQSSVKRKVGATGAEDPWLYPNLLDAASATANDSTDMDVDQSHGYFLQYILRAHSRSTHDGQDEEDNDTWAVAFQPTLPVSRSYDQSHLSEDNESEKELADEEVNESGHDSDEDSEDSRARKRSRKIAKEKSRRKKSSTTVATCGGNTVCLIDCSLGRVMAKYSHVSEEEFMCLAWTTLDHYDDEDDEAESKKETQAEDRHDQSNILAAAGRMGSIKLINPLQNTCYKYLHGHTGSVVRLKFSLTNPRWLFSASTDGTARLWDIGSLTNFQNEACCLARFVGLDDTSVTAIGVSEKYLIIGTEKGLMAQYNLAELTKDIKTGKKSTHLVKPEKIYPPSQEWHESAVDEIIYIPYFSEESYAAKKSRAESAKKSSPKWSGKGADRGKPRGGSGRGRGHSNGGSSRKGKNQQHVKDGVEDEDEVDGGDTEDIYEGEFVFASRESCQGEIIVWEASKSTESDAKLETILEWPIAESWVKFTLGENMTKAQKNAPGSGERKRQQKRQNMLVAGSTDGKIIVYDLGRKPKRARDGNIIAAKPSNIISHPDSDELFRDVAVSQDLSTIVAGDWSNRVYIWSYHENLAHP